MNGFWRLFPFAYSKHPVRDLFISSFYLSVISVLGISTVRQAILVARLQSEPMSVIAIASPLRTPKSTKAPNQQQQYLTEIDEIATGSIEPSYGNQAIHLDPCTGLIKN